MWLQPPRLRRPGAPGRPITCYLVRRVRALLRRPQVRQRPLGKACCEGVERPPQGAVACGAEQGRGDSRGDGWSVEACGWDRAGAAGAAVPVRRVMAFLDQRAGRWSLRGHSVKARQAHGNIDLLFDEAAMVNEPFLDLMTSLVAGIGSTDGRGGTLIKQQSVTLAWSEEWSAEASKASLALKRGPVKKPARALQKLVRLYKRDVAMLTDLVRCTVLAEDLRQVEALMATLAARSVVGPTGAEKGGRGAGGEDPMLEMDKSDGGKIFRITAIKNRFD
ncbi:hypothetical protein T484DRAFT_1959194, partial [Baffinella frigidus]